AQLAPMPQPDFKVGSKETGLVNGREVTTTLVSEDANARSWSRTDGCTATTPKVGFGPALKWNNCYGTSGTATVTLQGEVWPLTVGKMWSYNYGGFDGQYNFNGTRSCEVKGTV